MAAGPSNFTYVPDESVLMIELLSNNVDSEDEEEEDGSYLDRFSLVSGENNDESMVQNTVSVSEVIQDDYSNGENESDNDEEPATKRKKTAGKKSKKKDDVPPGFDINMWKDGDHPLAGLPAFDDNTSGFCFDIPDDADELFFFKLFVTDELLEYITYQTNLYAEQYFALNMDKLPEKSRIRKFIGGTDVDRILVFICLTYYMGLVKKPDINN